MALIETSKIKTFFIYALVIANIFLLFLVVPSQLESGARAQAMGQTLSSLLEDYGISFDPEILSEHVTLRQLKFTDSDKIELAAVRQLLGSSPVHQEDSGTVSSIYIAASGRAEFRKDGEFLISFNDSPGETRADTLLKQMGFDVWGEIADDGGALTATQSISDMPVFSSLAKIVYDGDELKLISGTWFVGSSQSLPDTDCVSAATALIAFLNSQETLGWICTEITDVQQGYIRADTPALDDLQLTPVWRITTDSGVFEVSGVNCSVRVIQ